MKPHDRESVISKKRYSFMTIWKNGLHTLEQTRQNIMMTKNDKSIGAVAHLIEHQKSTRKLTDVGS